jgi:ubiquinone/menaquinone biosynthesis C-methylase UbiE
MSNEIDYRQAVFGAHWALSRGDRNLGGIRLDRALGALAQEPTVQDGSILEAGCGVGRFTAPLAASLPGARMAALDLSAAALAQATRRAARPYYNVGDALALPFATGAFDALVFFDLLEHLVRPGTALAEFARVLRPGGVLHGYIPCEGQPPTLHWLLRRWVHRWTARHAGHLAHMRHTQVTAMVEAAGFEVVGLSYSYHLLGQILDVATFAVREMVFRRQESGSDRPKAYYDRSALSNGALQCAYGPARRAAEAVTYAEARLLSWCPWALGLHVTARRTRQN